jgi:CxxC-x17-CxxC domain-containing protein
MTDFNKTNRYGGGDRGGNKFGGHGGGSRGPRRDFGDKPMFQATCAECKKQCEVPFRPSGERPVYCKDCFSTKDRAPGAGGDFGKRDFSRERPAPTGNFVKRDFSVDNRTQTPRPGASVDHTEDIRRQLDKLNSKIDLLIQTLKQTTPKPAVAPIIVKPVAITKPVVLKTAVNKPVATKVKAKTVAKVSAPKTLKKPKISKSANKK